jgi:hypothetical protein
MAEAKPMDYAAKIEWLNRELQREQVALQALEAKRESVFLDGGNVATLLKDMSNGQERINVIERNIETAKRRQAEARAEAAWETVETEAEVVRETVVPELERKWRGLHDLMLAVDEAAEAINADIGVVEAFNLSVRMGDYIQGEYQGDDEAMFVAAGAPRLSARKPSRADLLVDLDAMRVRLSQALTVAPELPALTPFAGETQANFNLRTLNRAARLDSMARAGDPLKLAAERSRDAIERLVLASSPFEAMRRVVSIEKFVDHTGTGATSKIQAIDGKRAPPKRIGVDRQVVPATAGSDAA